MVLKNNKGFTLVEMIIVCAILVVVIMITGDAFNKILSVSRKSMATEESNIEGVVGLEMFRHDLEQAGYGLPWVSMDDDLVLPAYSEAASAPHSSYNENGGSGSAISTQIPRALVFGENISAASDTVTAGTFNLMSGTDYLAIKASSVGVSQDSRRWTYVNYSYSQKPPHKWQSENIRENAGVILIRHEIVTLASGGAETSVPKLIYDPLDTSGTYFSRQYPADEAKFPKDFSPPNSTDKNKHIVYGITDPDETPRMPFNRVNYFVAKPADLSKFPKNCADNTGILYKTVVNHDDGKLTYIPVLDCVADMQIELGWDFNGKGVDAYSDVSGINVSGNSTTADIQAALLNPELLRNNLKIIKVYLMVQEGRRDPGYSNQSNPQLVVGNSDTTNNTKIYTAADFITKKWDNYRWKVYRIVTKPKNLLGS